MRGWLEGHCGLAGPLLEEAIRRDALGYCDRREFSRWLGTVWENRPPDVFHDFRESFAAYIAPDPLLLELLREVREHRRIAILTNGTSFSQRPKIERLRLDEVFEPTAILISEEIDVWKPDPEAFRTAARAVGAPVGETLYVGDNPDVDIRGAKAAGLRTCWVALGRQFPSTDVPDYVVEDIARFRDVVV